MKYDIESILEMYEDDYNPDPRPMAQEPRNMYSDGQLVQPNIDGSRPGYNGKKNYVSGYSEKARAANKVKFEKTLKEMLEEINGLTQKGYGNVTNIVEKYSNKLGPPKDKVQKYYSKDGSFKGFNFNDEQRKIRGAVIAETKKLNLIDMPNNMIKAVEDYKKLGKEIPRGMPQKIIKANKVPESQFYKILNKVDVFVKQKKKFTNLDASKKFQQDQRAAALKEYSSDGFERMTRGSKTIQGGHTGDIYNEFVTTSTKAYTPAKINQEALKEVDGTLKNIGLKRDAAIKAKDFVEVERLNTKGINLSAATEGYKTFKVVQPDGSDYIYGINQKITTDPMDLTRNLDVKELTSGKDKEFNLAKKRFKAKQITAEEFEIARTKAEKKLFNEGTSKELIKVQKKNAMKNAKISTKETNRISKQILSAMEKLGCGQAAGGRINMRTGGLTDCAIAGQKKITKGLAVGFKEGEGALAQKILQAGKGLKNMVALRSLLGPAALGFTVAAEAGIVGYDMLATGKSFKDVVGNSLFNNLLGDKTKIDTDEIRYKNYERLGINTDQIKKFEEGLGEINQMAQVYNDAENSNYKMLMGQTTSNPRVSQAMRDRSNKALILKNEKNQQAATDLTTELSNPEKQKSLNEFAENTDLNRSLIASADQRVAADEIQKPSTTNFRSGMQTIFPRSNYDSETDKIINYEPVMQDYYRTNQYSAGGIADLMKKKND